MKAPNSERWQAALRGSKAAEIAHCIAAGVDVNEPISWDPIYPASPPLCIAARSGERADGVRLLLEAGADANAIEQPAQKPKKGWLYGFDSPLIVAARAGNPESVALLLDAGADPSYCSTIHDSALHNAILHFNAKRFLAVIAMLLDHGCAPHYTPSGRSLLMVAAGNPKCRGIIVDLVHRGADPNVLDQRWQSVPLHQAVQTNNAQAVAELLEAGADPDALAPHSGSWEWAGLTPVDYARKLNRKKLVELLERSKSKVATKPVRKGLTKSASKSATKPVRKDKTPKEARRGKRS